MQTMANKCTVCGKGPQYGNLTSYSFRKTRRRFMPNLQRIKILVNGSPRRVQVCTTCIKSGRVVRAV
jgi:large subunit ribosomal protein L28